MNTPINASPVSNDNRASSLNAVVWLLCALSASFVGPRFYSRIAITRNLGWDDWTILAALVSKVVPQTRCKYLSHEQIFTIAFSICVTLYTVNGGGRHFARLNNSQIELATKYNWLNHTFAIFSVTISKVSVALLILRLLGPSKWRKWFLYILSSLSCLFGGLAAIFIWVQCTPVETLWIPTAGTCWDLTAVNNYDLFVSSKSRCGSQHKNQSPAHTERLVGFCRLHVRPSSYIYHLELTTQREKEGRLGIASGFGCFVSNILPSNQNKCVSPPYHHLVQRYALWLRHLTFPR